MLSKPSWEQIKKLLEEVRRSTELPPMPELDCFNKNFVAAIRDCYLMDTKLGFGFSPLLKKKGRDEFLEDCELYDKYALLAKERYQEYTDDDVYWLYTLDCFNKNKEKTNER